MKIWNDRVVHLKLILHCKSAILQFKKKKRRKINMLLQVLRKGELASCLVETGSALREIQVSYLLCES